jgi:hypothetical protein
LLASIQFRFFHLPISNQEMKWLIYIQNNNLSSLYGHKTWSVSVREGLGWKCFKTGCWGDYMSKWEEVTGGLISFDEELYMLYSLPNITKIIRSRMMRWVGNLAWCERGENFVHHLFGKSKRKRWLEWLIYRCEDNIKIVLERILCESVQWIQLTHGRIQ